MESCCPLPFFAAPGLLPAPLPTADTITASQDALQEDSSRRIVRVGTHFIVKYGTGVSLTEGETMLFVKKVSTIPVPNLYALYSRKNEGTNHTTNYIVMENIAGESLASRWVSLNTAEKVAVAGQLRSYFTQLRQIPSPGYFGLLGKRPFEDFVFRVGAIANQQMLSGPFDTVQKMLDAMVQKHLLRKPELQKSKYYNRVLPLVIRNHVPIFTHGDFQRKNILIKNDGEVVMIDWEAAGWYPTFWEYSMAIYSCNWKDDWHLWVVKVLDEYPNEYAWMDTLFRELWP
ncbi:phosphotransferase enzyme family protein [Zalerion maritima]|uniref:Phosphotransferase enzyme family protein n=1 Tax=Zalerion maritima TaxID=339359 RepID=A0AAD5WP94_9PEZI|nr:phosphotransferase enzyme family protein [Zalerion maritima]